MKSHVCLRQITADQDATHRWEASFLLTNSPLNCMLTDNITILTGILYPLQRMLNMTATVSISI